MTQWKKYPDNRLAIDRGSYISVKSEEVVQNVSLSCQICNRLNRTQDDLESCKEFNCCYKCALDFAHPDRERWASGWRPSKESVSTSIERRLPLMLPITLEE